MIRSYSMIYLRKHYLFVFLLCLTVILWWVLRSPAFDSTQPSLIQDGANYPILSPETLPRQPNNDIFLLVIVSSAPSGVSIQRRETIRKTWGKEDPSSDRKWRAVFMTGKADSNKELLMESETYGDLLIYDYKDQYDQILNKLLGSFGWATSVQKSQKFQYVLKTDDDVYVNIPRLFSWLDHVGSKLPHVYAGNTYRNYVVRDKNHRHYISVDDLPYPVFPTFCKGSMFVFSSSLLPKIVEFSRKVRRIGPDDAYIGLIMNELKVNPVKIQGFVQSGTFIPIIMKLLGPCVFKNSIGIGDSLTTNQIWDLHYIHYPVLQGFKSTLLCISTWMRVLLYICVLILICFFKKIRNSKMFQFL